MAIQYRVDYKYIKKDNLINVEIITSDNYFNENRLIIRIGNEFKKIENEFKLADKEIIKQKLNNFFLHCIKNCSEEIIKVQIQLTFYRRLINYAQHFNSKETCLNILNFLRNSPDAKLLLRYYSTETQLLHAQNLLSYYQILKNEGIPEIEIIDILLEAKYYLFTLYSKNLAKEIELNLLNMETNYNLLSACLAQLSRWYEPLYFLNKDKNILFNNPQGNYLSAINLDSLKNKTCLGISPLLLLKINDIAYEAINSKDLYQIQIDLLEKMISKNKQILKSNNLKIKELRKHHTKSIRKHKLNSYLKFCFEKHLFLNEHYMFCNCSKAIEDSLNIYTNHDHTKIDWTKDYNEILESLKNDFIIARTCYYFSLDNAKINENFYTYKTKSLDRLKKSLLKNSFKTCYSILDQIGIAILEALSKDYYKLKRRLNFLNIWDEKYKLIKDIDFNNNFYLNSLYSIAMDLKREYEFSALDTYKDIRNDMEHNLFIIEDFPSIQFATSYKKQTIVENTELLLILTKSAIHSYTYFIRRASIKKYKEDKDHKPDLADL